jgi:uncharacterized membrane protein YbhN (UPF0104 family)
MRHYGEAVREAIATSISAERSPQPDGEELVRLEDRGMQARPAVWAVLLYRLATYWLPVLPGWLSRRSLQHREYG